MPQKQETFECRVTRIAFRSPDNGFTIATARTPIGQLSIKGYMPSIAPGMRLSVTGTLGEHPKYGPFFSVSSFEEVLPSSEDGILEYLSAGFVSGIGPEIAGRIVKAFGKDTLDVINNHPDRLMAIRGISKKKLKGIIESLEEKKDIQDILIFLKTYGIDGFREASATKIFGKYGRGAVSQLRRNPYLLAGGQDETGDSGVEGIGFRKADRIALASGIPSDSPLRLEAALLYCLSQNTEKGGNVFTGWQELLGLAEKELTNESDNLPMELLSEALEKLTNDSNKAICDLGPEDWRIYVPMYWHTERKLALMLSDKTSGHTRKRKINFDRLQKTCGITFDDVQQEAITLAANSRICVITGGPGTGKTTTMKGVIGEARSRGLDILLAAPTGRAAKRLSETTGMEAKTIHRLLEYQPGTGFNINENVPLKGDLLVVDETSMVDMMLMYNLMRAVPDNMRVVLVGDVNQLPSIGAGNVLHDIIESGEIPTVRLTKIYRQAQESLIVSNAHAINTGRFPRLPDDLMSGNEDFYFLEPCEENADNLAERTADTIIELVSKYISDIFGYGPEDIQVLTPMHKGSLGTESLNTRLQDILNPKTVQAEEQSVFNLWQTSGGTRTKNTLTFGSTEFREDDRVMLTKNNYEWNVFNGDMGTIVHIDTREKRLIIDFDGKTVSAAVADLENIVLAYACTIHKSQGSEYPVVVIPVVKQHYAMLTRNLIYTAVTRARSLCIMLGQKSALAIAVNNNTTAYRNSALAERIQMPD